MIMKMYNVITSFELKSLICMVNAAIAEGWMPIGGVTMMWDENETGVCAQAMFFNRVS